MITVDAMAEKGLNAEPGSVKNNAPNANAATIAIAPAIIANPKNVLPITPSHI